MLVYKWFIVLFYLLQGKSIVSHNSKQDYQEGDEKLVGS